MASPEFQPVYLKDLQISIHPRNFNHTVGSPTTFSKERPSNNPPAQTLINTALPAGTRISENKQ